MKTADNVEIRVGMTIFIYPGDSIIGGTIEERIVGGFDGEHRIVFDKPDDEGYIGIRRLNAYGVKEAAEVARAHDRNDPKFFSQEV